MEVFYTRCCGLDVHKSSITACVRLHDGGGKPRKIVRRFGAMTNDLRAMASWLIEEGVTHVAMESTGVYWKPVWNILEGQFTLVLANAQHVKNVPGRKTDTKDSEWLAELLQHGLLAGSFVPPRLIRDLRDLTRTRATLTQESSRIASRIQKVLEDANIKLASVASDALVSQQEFLIHCSGDIGEQARPRHLGFLSNLYPRESEIVGAVWVAEAYSKREAVQNPKLRYFKPFEFLTTRDDDAQLFAQSRTLRIRQRNSFEFSNVTSTSPLRTVAILPPIDFHELARAAGPKMTTKDENRRV